MARNPRNAAPAGAGSRNGLPGQVVLVLQGGGALGAYQIGVYQALHEAGIEPDWVIGTSIGAINGAIIAGNPPERRLARLEAFWNTVRQQQFLSTLPPWLGIANLLSNLSMYTRGVEGFFAPNPGAAWGLHAGVGVERAAYYTTGPLYATLQGLVDFPCINSKLVRLTLGAVNVRSGEMSYFDNRDMALDVRHVMASGALPPAFPAVRIDGDPYWDGGIYSNTPMEVVLDDKPRRDSVIFAANLWHATGPEPGSIWDVLGRQKDIQYASRAASHVRRQQQIHRLRHVIRELSKRLPPAQGADSELQELVSYGCATVMHVVPLNVPRLDGEDHTKDIDFTPAGIGGRREAGYAATRDALERAPWNGTADSIEGVIIHEPPG
jgi:NTE family protein